MGPGAIRQERARPGDNHWACVHLASIGGMARLQVALAAAFRQRARNRVMVQIVGYPDRMAVRAGETIAFKVSCESEVQHYRAEIVRLRCGDDRPGGPGFSASTVPAAVNGEYLGCRQPIGCGSYIAVPYDAVMDELQSFTLAA